MERINGLREYVRRDSYLEALAIPRGIEVEYKMLAQGEYNINYIFIHPLTGQKLLLRVNTASQMHLCDQIQYEYKTLLDLRESGRTPKPVYVDGSMKYINYGVMVMNFLEGTALDYIQHLNLAAECLADIHSLRVDEGTHLISPENPLQAVLDECNQMAQTYYDSVLANQMKKSQIKNMLEMGRKKLQDAGIYTGYRCCINTELNSTNFLINGEKRPNYLIDWEKPLLGDPAQDLGHFLAPTTTFWKTDVILTQEEMKLFVKHYEQSVAGRFDAGNLQERVDLYVPITCLRGITWCAMAWVQYQNPDKLIRNESTYLKLESYLDKQFLDRIENQYFK